MLMADNIYTEMQKRQYENGAWEMNNGGLGGHQIHNSNPDYWGILLKDVLFDEWSVGKSALDFGCGCGRNIINLLRINKLNRVDGVDISANNIEYTRQNLLNVFGNDFLNNKQVDLYINNGIDLNIQDNMYDFVMSTIVFQHICVREIRINLMKEIYRVMKKDGIFSFQMGYDPDITKVSPKERFRDYYDNYYEAKGTNSICDCMISDTEQITMDLKDIGFKNISFEIRPQFCDMHQNWLFLRCVK